MFTNRFKQNRRSHLSQVLSAFALTTAFGAIVAIPVDAQGRRGGDSSSRDSGSRDSGSKDSGPKQESRDSSRSAPSHDSAPSSHDRGSSSSRESSPVNHDRGSSPSRDYTPRQDSGRTIDSGRTAPTRDYAPRQDSGRTSDSERNTPSRDYAPRQDSGRTVDSGRTTPTRDYAPRQDSGRTVESGRTTPTRDSSPRQDSGRTIDTGRTAPTRDNSPQRDSNSTRPNYRDSGTARNENPTRHEPVAPRLPYTGRGSALTERGAGVRTGPTSGRDARGYDIFTRSREGRSYGNGIYARDAVVFHDNRFNNYFPYGYSYYPNYAPTYSVSLTFGSPYCYYYGAYPPYIYRSHCVYEYPSYVYIDVPVYDGSYYRSYDRDDDYYLSRRSYNDIDNISDSSLKNAVEDIRDAFRLTNINSLANLIDPNIKIAVFLKGKYDYSINGNDYIDMTRDMLKSTDTIQFDFTRFRQRADGVYVVSGKHVYADHGGQRHSVYLSFVIEKLGGRWTLTQVGTAPDRIQEPR